MTTPRYVPRDVIAGALSLIRRGNPDMAGPSPQDYRSADDLLDTLYRYGLHVLDLPDAEHVHLTRNPDGTWTAVAMRPFASERKQRYLTLGDVWVDGEVL